MWLGQRLLRESGNCISIEWVMLKPLHWRMGYGLWFDIFWLLVSKATRNFPIPLLCLWSVLKNHTESNVS